ncbi:MAG: transglycosylase domain-containing protein, partial [Rhodothermales bacterium]|nr:transglycosylase domain-containing protein [Rhodothermales bacterium]
MSQYQYTEEELRQYFADPSRRQRDGAPTNGTGDPPENWRDRIRRFVAGRTSSERQSQAVYALGSIMLAAILATVAVGIYFLTLTDDLPSLEQLENPDFQLATVAYTADGVELQRYARQNRSWAHFEEISPGVIDALVATEDHRFMDHWGIDIVRTMAIPFHVLRGDPQGGSTLSQQLARNLYNEEIGREVTVERKLKEMVTAVQLERRYTKREIIEMYLNTVEFGNNAFGIDAAARTFFGKTPAELDTLEGATLVGMLQAITRYNPVRNPENARRRRNVVLSQMVKREKITQTFYEAHRDDSVKTSYQSSEITQGLAPYFAEYVRNWTADWGRENGLDIYRDGLVVYTTLDSELQKRAQHSVARYMDPLQKVVDYEWSRRSGYELSTDLDAYTEAADYEPFAYYWSSNKSTIDSFIRETERYRRLRNEGLDQREAVASLREDEAFMDSVRANKTRLEAGVVAIEPRTGYVKAWVGGRDLATDWFDHVAIAKRQPGSTFKPFVYTAAIDNGYSPLHELKDSTFYHVDPLGNEWRPGNSGGDSLGSGQMLTLREGLARSKNTITGRLVMLVSPREVAFYARRMGIQSRLEEVPSIALGTSDVSLLELTGSYSTLASGGEYHEPTVVTRIEDRFGNVLYEAEPRPQMAISQETAYVVVDMMRDVIRYGTGVRMRGQFGLGEFDLAGKTGTTQNNADGWFMAMHPELVVGAWVGFNDRRITFRSDWWGQGAH